MRKRTRRKVYPLINPIESAVLGACISAEKPLDKLRLAELSAIDNLAFGRGTTEDWRWVCDFLNIAQTMGNMGIGPEVLPVCEVAQNGLLQAAKRYQEAKKMGIDGVTLNAIRELHEYHDLQRTSVARSVYETAIKKTADRIRSRAKDVVEIV
jgi:hypothetical protein